MNFLKQLRFGGVFGGVTQFTGNSSAMNPKELWYARVDSNHRPFAPEANALSS